MKLRGDKRQKEKPEPFFLFEQRKSGEQDDGGEHLPHPVEEVEVVHTRDQQKDGQRITRGVLVNAVYDQGDGGKTRQSEYWNISAEQPGAEQVQHAPERLVRAQNLRIRFIFRQGVYVDIVAVIRADPVAPSDDNAEKRREQQTAYKLPAV